MTILVAAVLNDEPNAGAQVAEAVVRVDRQVGDTQAAGRDIKEFSPDEPGFQNQAVPSGAAATEPGSQANAEPASSVHAGA